MQEPLTFSTGSGSLRLVAKRYLQKDSGGKMDFYF